MSKVFNPGELNEKIYVLKIKELESTYLWEKDSYLHAKVEQLTSNNLFSRVGLGAKSVKFTIRKKSNLTLHDAFSWKGKHCFLTDVVDIDRMYYEITAALIEPVLCTVERTKEPILGELNRPIYDESLHTIKFPACMTEKYIKQIQEQPMTTIESCYVLVTPKVIELINGELVTINDVAYEVLVSHTLDDYKNEYEIKERRNP